MSVTIRIIVEDITTRLLTYDEIQLERASTAGGSYSLVETESLVASTYYYSITDDSGDINKYYRYRFHNDTGPANSGYSDPFRVEGVSRLRARQAALEEHGAGMVLAAVGGDNDTDTFATDDYRAKSTLFRTDRGKGTWLLPTTGDEAGNPRTVKSSVPSSGTFDVNPAWSTGPSDGDEVEWHWLADPDVWNSAAVRAMARYWYVERVPLVGVANQEEYNLESLPFLRDKEQVHDVRWYPTSGLDVDESFGVNGRWWRIREDVGVLTLQINPAVDADQLLYLETTRPMLPLYTDASVAPAVAAEELVAALMYDEVLAHLSSPGRGTADVRKVWREARALNAGKLHRLLVKHRPKPRQGTPQLPWPPVTPQPWTAR